MEKSGPPEDFSPYPSPLPASSMASGASAEQLEIGQLIDNRYRVDSLLGKGGFGRVYKVTRLLDRQEFALKLLTDASMSETLIRRFRAEAKAAMKLDHQNLVRAIDLGVFEDRMPFMVMEYIHGPTLSAYLKQQTTLSAAQVLKLFSPIALGLAYAHDQGVVHRDIKPSNIILAKDGNSFQPKIVDFGIAKIQFSDESQMQTLTKTGDIFGTPLYMSPEQCRGTTADARSDIYSLGCVMFEALSGTPPFRGNNPLETMMQHSQEPAPSLKHASLGKEFPEKLELIVRKMLEKDPADRYQNCYSLATDLNAFASGNKVELQPSRSKQPPTVKKSRSTALIMTVTSLSLAVGSLFFYMQLNRSTVDQKPIRTGAKRLEDLTQTINKSDEASLSEVIGDEKIFHFDPNFNAGKLIWGRNQSQQAVAEGTVHVPKNARIIFEPNSFIVNQPAYLTRFRSDDLFGIALKGNDAVSAIGDLDSVLRMLRTQDNLQALSLENFDTDQSALTEIGRMRQLRWLQLFSVKLESKTLTGNEIKNLENLKQLQYLGINTAENLTPLFKRLTESTALHHLSLRFIRDLSEKDLILLDNIPNLQKLSIFTTNFRVFPWETLARAPMLTELHIFQSFILEAQIMNLAKSKSLKKLLLEGLSDSRRKVDKLEVVVRKGVYDETSDIDSPVDELEMKN